MKAVANYWHMEFLKNKSKYIFKYFTTAATFRFLIYTSFYPASANLEDIWFPGHHEHDDASLLDSSFSSFS